MRGHVEEGAHVPHLRGMLDGHHEEKESWINGQIVIIIAVLGGG